MFNFTKKTNLFLTEPAPLICSGASSDRLRSSGINNFMKICIFFLILFYIISGNVIVSQNISNISISAVAYEALVDSIISTGKLYLGKPYRFRNSKNEIMDCSGFLSYIFSQHNIPLSKSSQAIASNTVRIDLNDVRKGDLLFFKGRNILSPAVGHVSMVIEKNINEFTMLHSCRRGVIIEKYPVKYYKERFLFAGRVPELEKNMYIFQEQLSDTAAIEQITHISEIISEFAIHDDKIPVKDTISIIGVGDIMLGTNYPSEQYLPPDDGKFLLTPVKDILQNADITFGNLEGVLLTGDGPVKKCSNPKFCYAFKSPDHYVNYLKDAGFDVLSIANNHINDFGEKGRNNTVKVLKNAGIYFAGILEYPYEIFEKDGITYGFCAFSPNAATVKLNDYDTVRQIISHLDSLCNIVIVSFHGGAEGKNFQNISKKTEYYLGENRGNPYEFASIAIDAGADIVFGHGPHVTRAIDIYKNRFIAYSLGNFATYGRFNLAGSHGVAIVIKVYVTKDGEFLYGKIFPIKQQGKGGPIPDPDNTALKEIINLTKKDFPQSELVITVEGDVYLKKNFIPR